MSSETWVTIGSGAAIVGVIVSVLIWQIGTVNTRIDDVRDTVNTSTEQTNAQMLELRGYIVGHFDGHPTN